MKTLYTIGEVHQMTGISVSALRYYADMGIVIPERIDGQTGYRYYSFADVRRLETVGYLKEAGLSLAEIARVMAREDAGGRRVIFEKHQNQARKQMQALQKKMQVLEWMMAQEGAEEGSAPAFKIYPKTLPSRRVFIAESAVPCDVEQMYRLAGRQWQQLGIVPGRRTMGYLLNEVDFMQHQRLGLEAQFLAAESGDDCENRVCHMLLKGDYICLATAIFRDDRWIRALSRYFKEKDIRPRNILAVQTRQDFTHWERSVYEVQVLI